MFQLEVTGKVGNFGPMMLLESPANLVEIESVVARRFGFEDLHGFIERRRLIGFSIDVVARFLAASGDPFWTFSPFGDDAFLDDVVVGCFGVACTLVVSMVVVEVEVVCIAGVEFPAERDKSVEMSITVFVKFLTDDDVLRVARFEEFEEEVDEVLRFSVTMGVSQEQVLALDAKTTGRHDGDRRRGYNITIPSGG